MSNYYEWSEFPEIIVGNSYAYKQLIFKNYIIEFDVDWYIQMSTNSPYGFNHLYMNTKAYNVYISAGGKRVRLMPRSDQYNLTHIDYSDYIISVLRWTNDERLRNLRYLLAPDSVYFDNARHNIETGEYYTQMHGAAFNLNSDYASLEVVPDVVRGRVYTSHVCIKCNYGLNFNNTNVFEKINDELYAFKNMHTYKYSNMNIEHRADLRVNNLNYLKYRADPTAIASHLCVLESCNDGTALPFNPKINVTVTGNWKSFSYNTTDNFAMCAGEYKPISYYEYTIDYSSNQQIYYIDTQTYRNKVLNWDYNNNTYDLNPDKIILDPFESCIGVVQSEPVKVNETQFYVDYTFTVTKVYKHCKCSIDILDNNYVLDLDTIHSETKRIYLSFTRYKKVYISYSIYFSAPNYILLLTPSYTFAWNTTLILFSPLINNYEHDAITINKDYAIIGNVTNPTAGAVNIDAINIFSYTGKGAVVNNETLEKIFITQTDFLVRTNNSCVILEAFFVTQLNDSIAYDYLTIGDNYTIVINNHTYTLQLIHTAVATTGKESILFKLLNLPELLDDFIDYKVIVNFNNSTKKLSFTVEPYID